MIATPKPLEPSKQTFLDTPDTAGGPLPVIATQAVHSAATWADAHNLYAVVTDAGADTLRRVL